MKPTRTLSRLILLSSIFCLINSSAQSSPILCSELLSVESKLSSKSEALKKAKDTGFDIRVLHGQVNGREVEISLFGEVHINSKEEIAAADEVRTHYDLRAHEGVETGTYWFPNLLNRAFRYIYKGFQAYADDRGYEKAVSNISRSAGEVRESSGGLIGIPLETIRFGNKPSLRAKILAIISSIGFVSKELYEKATFNLFYKPAGFIFGCGALACSGSYIAIPLALGAVGYGSAVTSGIGLRNWGKARDELMIKNLFSGLTVHKDYDSVLVIVGKNHVNNLEEILKKRHGFELKADSDQTMKGVNDSLNESASETGENPK